jgi:signal transduction histidine kinase
VSDGGARRWWPTLRLRHKIGASLVIAALLPVLVASWVAFSVVLRGLNRGLETETRRQLDVGVNLLLQRIESIGAAAAQMAGSREMEEAIGDGAVAAVAAADRLAAGGEAALIQIAGADGQLVAIASAGSRPERFDGIGVAAGDPLIAAGHRLERRVTLARVGRQLIARAVAPITDAHFKRRGMIIFSVPLDGLFADELKASLGTDVLLFTGTDASSPARTTFVDSLGRRATGIRLDPEAAARVAAGEPTLSRARIEGGELSLGYAPIIDAAGAIVGVFAVAVDRGSLISARRTATRSLALGAAGAIVFALGLAGLLSRRISRPLAKLHRGAIAIARGDLDHRMEMEEGDEIGDLATAFGHMTAALKENQQRLAARMREIVALHDAGRAVSSVLDLEQVLRKIVDSVARVLHVRVCALWLVDDPERVRPDGRIRLSLGAARAKRSDMRMISRGDEVAAMIAPLADIASEVARDRATLRVDDVESDPDRREPAIAAGISGSLVATPLERKGVVLGVIVIGRTEEARPFSEADSNLLATFADQAAAAVENASLYAEVRAASEELEAKVRLRTTELTAINAELGRTITELRETQAQLVLSERLAGLGQLVAGVAHEINSPSAAIRGTVDVLPGTALRLADAAAGLYRAGVAPEEHQVLGDLALVLAARSSRPTEVVAPATLRRQRKELSERLADAGIEAATADRVGRVLVELQLEPEHLEAAVELVVASSERAYALAVYLREQMYLHRAVSTIGQAITRIQRIVGELKSYSHLDQEASRSEADVHEGLESTLALFEHATSRRVEIERKYGELPKIWAYVDELNQVWTNLIHNAIQAMSGEGTITIETRSAAAGIEVSITDDGPGIPEDVLPSIFEPFFTTKPRGEGTGLGLGIARKIVGKHGGTLDCESEPGATCFTVWLPVAAPVKGAEGVVSPG